MAKAAVTHFGPTICPVISKLAAADPKKGEDVAHKVSLAHKPAKDSFCSTKKCSVASRILTLILERSRLLGIFPIR